MRNVLAAPVAPELLRRYDVPGPRYTSYPTVDRFVQAFTEVDYVQALQQRRRGAAALKRPLSLYVHIPFCRSLCYYCGCHKIISRQQAPATLYLNYLERELALHAAELGSGQVLSQLHLGGGTPTFLPDSELRRLMDMLRRHFTWSQEAECAIEVDPRTVDKQRLQVLASLGFNRLSFGVQDFDPQVLKAVHREQAAARVFELVQAARDLGFASVNVDLLYGLPLQTPESMARTLAQVVNLRPDRIALYAYAHLPERFKPQRRIDPLALPGPEIKLGLFSQALASFLGSGYAYVGMDHFALPSDALAVAKRQGRLYRNFQGYSTQPDGDLIGLGVSALGRIGATYSQNTKSLEEYYDAIDHQHLPIACGLALSRDDVLRRAVIMSLMCQGQVVFEPFNLAYLIDFHRYFAHELAELVPMIEQGLVTLDAQGIQVTPQGWFLVRAVAMVFDRYVQADRNRARYSKII